jgi:hypothetical protein
MFSDSKWLLGTERRLLVEMEENPYYPFQVLRPGGIEFILIEIIYKLYSITICS